MRTRRETPSGQGWRRRRCWTEIAAVRASRAREKVARSESPWVSNSSSAISRMAVRRRCRSSVRTSAYRLPSCWSRRVDPSMSVKKKVTVLVGRLATTLPPRVHRSPTSEAVFAGDPTGSSEKPMSERTGTAGRALTSFRAKREHPGPIPRGPSKPWSSYSGAPLSALANHIPRSCEIFATQAIYDGDPHPAMRRFVFCQSLALLAPPSLSPKI
jgi:hypothetical protein